MTPLPIGDTLAATVDYHARTPTKGRKISRLVEEVRAYNVFVKSLDFRKIRKASIYEENVNEIRLRQSSLQRLESIAQSVTEYMAWRSPYATHSENSGHSRIKKWKDLDALKNAVVNHAMELGFKMLSAPEKAKNTTGDVGSAEYYFNWLEWFCPGIQLTPAPGESPRTVRIRGQELSVYFEQWLDRSESDPADRHSFWEFLQALPDERLRKIGLMQYQASSDSAWDMAVYDESAGRWMTEGKPITVDKYMIVVPPDGSDKQFLYAKCVNGKVHHSSLVGGRPVQFAGVFDMKNGKFKALNLFTGHYQIGLSTAKHWLKSLPDKLNQVEIKDSHGVTVAKPFELKDPRLKEKKESAVGYTPL